MFYILLFLEYIAVGVHSTILLLACVLSHNWLTQCPRDIVKYFFSNKVINRWNLLDQWTVDAQRIQV